MLQDRNTLFVGSFRISEVNDGNVNVYYYDDDDDDVRG